MIFDIFQLTMFNLSNKIFFYCDVNQMILSNTIMIFFEYSQNIDIIVLNFFDVFDKIKITFNVIV